MVTKGKVIVRHNYVDTRKSETEIDGAIQSDSARVSVE